MRNSDHVIRIAGDSAVPKQRLAEPAVPLPLGNAAMGRFVLWCDMGRFGTRWDLLASTVRHILWTSC